MKLFTFIAYGNVFEVEAENGTDVMEEANSVLLWNNPKSKEGYWMEYGSETFKWVEGNFFD